DGITPALSEPMHCVEPALVHFSYRRRWLGLDESLNGGTGPDAQIGGLIKKPFITIGGPMERWQVKIRSDT
ncbi:hypothetical protein ACI4CV_28015, partial [Klebsiella pneumoniae]|uniref:hypothetical protein n=1 Tax=Klebsiella pneumoniae TaxID=573 RepID=UPI003853E3E8